VGNPLTAEKNGSIVGFTQNCGSEFGFIYQANLHLFFKEEFNERKGLLYL